jgi:uncharacterized protein (UPF0332 family)
MRLPTEGIRGEFVRGDESRRAAGVLLREGLRRDAMSRAYYAALHYARALLLLKDEEPKTHEGVLRRFSLHFVRTGVLTVAEGKWLSRLHKLREEADYGVDREYTAGDIRVGLEGLEEFRSAVLRTLSAHGVEGVGEPSSMRPADL